MIISIDLGREAEIVATATIYSMRDVGCEAEIAASCDHRVITELNQKLKQKIQSIVKSVVITYSLSSGRRFY